MALWIADGFDMYASIGDMALNFWSSAASFLLSPISRFGYGQSLRADISFGGDVVSPAFSNQATVFAAVSYFYNNALGGSRSNEITVSFKDGGGSQVSVTFSSDGKIYVTTGGSGGSVIGTYSGAFLAQQWNQYQIQVVINNTTGEVHIRKNGNTVDDFVVTGVNTRGGTSNNYANTMEIIGSNATGGSFIDDFAAWDTTGSGLWTNWIGDARCFTAMPNADTAQKQFTQNNSGSTTFGSSSNMGNVTLAADTIYFFPITPTCGGILGNLSLTLNTALSGHINAALFDSNGNPTQFGAVPGTLLNTCSALTNPPSGANTLTWTSTATVQNKRQYYIGLWTDASTVVNTGAGTGTRLLYASTYTGTFPTNASGAGTPTSVNAWTLSAVIAPTNSGMINDWTEDGSTTFVSDGTPGDFDLYTIPPPPTNPSSILHLGVKALVAKSDAGSRTYATHVRSGGTDVDLPTYAPNTSYNYNVNYMFTDPNTAAAWTLSGVTALQVGPKVAS